MTSHAINFPPDDKACLPVKLENCRSPPFCRSPLPFSLPSLREGFSKSLHFPLRISLFSSGRRFIYRRIGGGGGSTAEALVFLDVFPFLE